MFGVGGSELVVIALVALLVFGPGRIPEVVRALANAYRELMKLRGQVGQTVSELRQDLDLNLEPLSSPVPRTRPAPPHSPARESAVPQAASGAESGSATQPPPAGEADDYLGLPAGPCDDVAAAAEAQEQAGSPTQSDQVKDGKRSAQ